MSETRSYNLLCQPWIPVVWRKDAAEPRAPKIGIREALRRAHEIKCISHTAPFIEFGLYRLLITIVLDSYIVVEQRPTIGKMKQMLHDREFDTSILGQYLDAYKDRFDLWHDQHPFLQMPGVNGIGDDISKMVAPVPSGTKITFWHHYAGNEIGLTAEEAARELCAVAPFCFDYAPKDICTIGGDPPLYVVVQGQSLFETIVYNLPRRSGRLSARQEMEGGPVWRCNVEDSSALPRSPTHTQGWTWPVRQLRLIHCEDSSVVGEAVNTAGAGKTAAKERVRGWRDPNAGTITDGKGIRHIRATDLVPSFARNAGQGDQNPMVFWRDLVPMCLVSSEGEALRGERLRSRPEVVTNVLRITEQERLGIAVYGFVDKGGKNNKVYRTWFRSVLVIPAEVARDNRLSYEAMNAFKDAQKVADALQKAMRMLRPKMEALPREKRRLKEPRRVEADTIAGFWQALEPLLAHSYLSDLATQKAGIHKNLKDCLRKEARSVFKQAAAPYRRDADGLFRIANASNWFERRLSWILPKPREEKNV